MRIFNLRNVLALAAVSYVLYLILWLALDDYTEAVPFRELVVDFLACLLFTFTSLACSYLMFQLLHSRDSFSWVVVYACCLFAINNLIAYGMVETLGLLWTKPDSEVLWFKEIYSYAMTATFVTSIYANVFYLRSFIKARDEKQALEMALMKEKEIALQSQLNSLKLQINPHFMFNNFNNLLELIDEDTTTAGRFLEHLSKVYRYIIANLDRDLIPVAEEMKFLDSYLYLMKVRHGEAVVANISPQLDGCGGFLPPAVLQLLVENAIKHNGFSKEQPLFIDITLTGNCITVRNLKRPLLSRMERAGLGLKNIVERYALLCDKEVKIEDTDNLYSVSLPLIANH